MLNASQNYHLKLNNFCLYLLVLTMLAGPLVYLGVAALYHFVIIGLLFIVLCKGVNTANLNTYIMLFLLIWLTEALLSVLWAPDSTVALRYVYYIFLIVAICVLFHCFLNKDNLIVFSRFMVFVLLFCNLIAFWEMATGNHLVKNYLATQQLLRILKYVPGGFYKNPNDFATFIVQILPFSCMCLYSSKKYIRIISFFNLAASFVTVCATQSRTQVIVLFLMYVFFAIILNKKKLIKMGFMVALIAIVLFFLSPNLKTLVNDAVKSAFNGALNSNATTEITSLYIRINLLKNAGYILLDSFGFGIGAGCHRVVMRDYANEYFNTNNISVMHNLLGELFTDYGILVGIMFLLMLVKSCNDLYKIHKTAENGEVRILAGMLAFFFAVFVICNMSSSSILQISSLWLTVCFSSAFIRMYKHT